MASRPLIFNGINASTGQYLPSPRTIHELAQLARGERWQRDHLEELRALQWRMSQDSGLAPPYGIDVKDLAASGWGVLFAKDCDPAVRDALTPLLKHRKQAAQWHYKEFDKDAYEPGLSKDAFLRRQKVGATGPADTRRVPYYLLLVGSPEQIPYRFQYELDVEYAVGRIYFNTPEEYANYANSVVAAEQHAPRTQSTQRRAVFFGPRNQDDIPTELSAQYLVGPLAASMAGRYPEWLISSLLGAAATKEQLGRLLGGSETPDFLFTASHGVWLPNEDSRKLAHQGALLCHEWPGPLAWQKAIPPKFYFSADDVAENAHLQGVISFHFACYSAGTPETDDFAEYSGAAPRPVHVPFLAAFPQRLLSHPKGGALAFIGHVERTWGYSFLNDQETESELLVFEETLGLLLRGFPVGYAMEPFSRRYAELSVELNNELDEINKGKPLDDDRLATTWISNNDARNYILLGDPAVRLGCARTETAEGNDV